VSISAEPQSADPHRAALPDSGRLLGLGLLLVTACSWGLNWPVAKFLLSELPPFTMRAVCCAVAVVFAFGLAVARRERLSVPRSQWPRLLVFATLNFGAFIVLTTLALAWLRASEAVIVTYTLPIWAAVIAWPVLGERLTVVSFLALLLGLGGVALLVGVDASDASWAKLPGVALALIAAVLFGLGTVLGKQRALALPPVAGVAWQLALSLLPVVLLAMTERQDWSRMTPLGWAAILFVAALPMTLAYVAWFRALLLLPAATAATGVLISPVVGVIGSALLLGDPLGARQVAALALTLTGVGLAALRPKRTIRGGTI
jgi:drug/metabolite transporter (DMT)-like permease